MSMSTVEASFGIRVTGLNEMRSLTKASEKLLSTNRELKNSFEMVNKVAENRLKQSKIKAKLASIEAEGYRKFSKALTDSKNASINDNTMKKMLVAKEQNIMQQKILNEETKKGQELAKVTAGIAQRVGVNYETATKEQIMAIDAVARKQIEVNGRYEQSVELYKKMIATAEGLNEVDNKHLQTIREIEMETKKWQSNFNKRIRETDIRTKQTTVGVRVPDITEERYKRGVIRSVVTPNGEVKDFMVPHGMSDMDKINTERRYKMEIAKRKMAMQDAKAVLREHNELERRYGILLNRINEQLRIRGRLEGKKQNLMIKDKAVSDMTIEQKKKVIQGQEIFLTKLREENEQMQINRTQQGKMRQSLMQLSISYFVILITLRSVIDTLTGMTKEGTFAREMVDQLGGTIMKAVPFIQLFTAITNMAMIKVTQLTLALGALGAVFLALVFLYKALNMESGKVRNAMFAMAAVFGVISAALSVYTMAQFMANSQLMLFKALTMDFATIAIAIGATLVLMSAFAGATYLLAKQNRAEIEGAQTFPGEARILKTGGLYRGHAGEIVTRPADVSNPFKSTPNITINIEAGARVDDEMINRLGEAIVRSV